VVEFLATDLSKLCHRRGDSDRWWAFDAQIANPDHSWRAGGRGV